MYQRTRSSWTKHFDFLLLDLACLCISYLAAFAIRFKGGLSAFSDSYRNFLIVILIIEFASSLMCSNLAGVLKRGPFAELLHVASLSLISLMVTTLYMFSAHNSGAFSRLLVYYTFLLFLVLDFLLRLGYKRLVIVRLKKRAASGASPRSAFLVAEKSSADALIDDLKKDFYENFSLNGIVITDDAQPRPEYRGIPAYASLEEAAKVICREWIDEVFVKVAATTPEIAKFTENCKEMGLVLHLVMNVKDAENSKQFVEDLGSNIVLTTAYNYMTPQQAFFKRSMDILGGLVGSVFTVLIGLVIGPIIYAKSPGPIFFKQTRIGKNGKKFNVIKFRSMYPDAEARKKEYLAQNRVSDGMMFKLDFDPRIIGNEVLPDGTHKTGIGEFIRKTSLDEFPQFFNVLKGDMSLVGTRPPTEDEWDKYEFHHRARLAVRPGITGMWQVSGRSEITDFEEVVRLDTEYITRFRTALDIKILFKTLLVIFQRKGAM